tara:strand:- start:348 stop:608 length:261 start_codon:yes stop_codon:yes gene_type:complete
MELIRIYSTDRCVPCFRLRQWMMLRDARKKGIKLADRVEFRYDNETGEDPKWDTIKAVPFMFDPNNGKEVYGENQIRAYLDKIEVK